MVLSQIQITEGLVPVGLQLKQQIKWLIAAEHLRPGDLLPSVREVSAALGLARNTVNTVYDELRDEGLLTMGRGRGTQVANTEQVRQCSRFASLLSLLDESFAAAAQQGFTPTEIAEAAHVRAQLLTGQQPEADPVTLVECGAHEVDFYIGQIKALTGRPVRFVALDALMQDISLAGDFFVTSCFHTDLRQKVGAEHVAFLGAGPDLKVILQVAQMPAGKRVGFVGRSPSAAAWMQRTVASAGVEHLRLESAGVDEPAADELLARADVIYAAPSLVGLVAERAPVASRVRSFDLVLDIGSQERLRSMAPATGRKGY